MGAFLPNSTFLLQLTVRFFNDVMALFQITEKLVGRLSADISLKNLLPDA
jgi:hypothetical protein